MTITELKSSFLQFMCENGHNPLQEIPLVTHSEDTFFTVAAAKAV